MPCKVAVLLTLMLSVLLSNSIAQASKHLKAEKALTQIALKQNLGDDLEFHVREFETAVRNDKDSGSIGLVFAGWRGKREGGEVIASGRWFENKEDIPKFYGKSRQRSDCEWSGFDGTTGWEIGSAGYSWKAVESFLVSLRQFSMSSSAMVKDWLTMVSGKLFKVNKETRKATEGHLTEFGNVCRQSEKLYNESREELFSRIPNFLDWKRQEVKVPFSSTTNTYEVRVIFTPADGGKEYVAILISANKNLVENLKVDASKGKRVMEWKRREGSMVTDRGRFDGHIQNQVAFVLEAETERKDSIHEYLTAIDLDAVSQAIVSRLKQNNLADPQEKSTGGDKSETANQSEQSERVRKKLEGIDFKGVQRFRLSSDGALAAGMTQLYPKPGNGSGSFSLIKIWSVDKKKLLNEFRIPGKAYEVAFSPDGTTVVSAERKGNLGYTTTVRAWNLLTGSEKKLGSFSNVTDKIFFSPDGLYSAAMAYPDYSMFGGYESDLSFKLIIWRVDGTENPKSIVIPNALGDFRATRLPMNEWTDEQKSAAADRVIPSLQGFSADGQQLMCVYKNGDRLAYDARSGSRLGHANMASVGVFKAMLMVTLSQLPPDAKVLEVVISPNGKKLRLERSVDGWWRAGKSQKMGFNVDREYLVTRVNGIENKDHILMGLGLGNDRNLADLTTISHPLGVIKIDRDKTELNFRLEEVTEGNESGKALQTFEVSWTPTKSKRSGTRKATEDLGGIINESTRPVATTAAANARTRPNVLFISVDDMNDWVGCLGSDRVPTPNVDALADRGLLFTNAHAPSPKCAPSRAAILTGKRASTTGLYSNGHWWRPSFPNVVTLPHYFKQNGYHVAGGGKVHHHTPGFNPPDQWHEYFDLIADNELIKGYLAKQGGKRSYLTDMPRHPKGSLDWGAMQVDDMEMGDGHTVEWASEFLSKKHDKPFFLAVGLFQPHLPFYAPKKYFDQLPLDRVTLPENKAGDLDDIPEGGRVMAEDRRNDLRMIEEHGGLKHCVQSYLCSIAHADTLVGKLLDAFDKSAYRDNTIVVFWSDHGYHFGEKDHFAKNTLWERSTHVPFIFVAPGLTKPSTRCDQPVDLTCLFPTLTSICGLPVPEGLDGFNVTSLLRAPDSQWKHPAIIDFMQGNTSVRTKHWRYIRYAEGRNGEELYNLQSDPNEWHNLVADHPDIVAKLKHALPTSYAATRPGKGDYRFNAEAYQWKNKTTGKVTYGGKR